MTKFNFNPLALKLMPVVICRRLQQTRI